MSARKSSELKPVSREDVRDAIADDWHKTEQRVGLGGLIDATGVTRRDTIDNAIRRKHTPELHTALNSLLADEAALFNTFQLFGGVFVRSRAGSAEDMVTISAMLHAATDYLDRMKDGQRCHVDTAALAKLFTPLVPALLAIIQEASGQKAGAKLRAVANG